MVIIEGVQYNDQKFQAVVSSATHGTVNPKEISELDKTVTGIRFSDVTLLKRGTQLYLLSDRAMVGEAISQGRTEIPVRIISKVALKKAIQQRNFA